jgi:hypothetical protein
MHTAHSWHSPFSVITPGFKYTENDQVPFVFFFAPLMISHNLGTPRISHILLHLTPFDHIHKTSKRTGAEE